MEPEMEDKTLELMVRRLSLWHLYHRFDQCPAYVEEPTRVSVDGENGQKRLVRRGGGERRGHQKSEGGPEIIVIFCRECLIYSWSE